jgi:hypothetical protein
MQIRKLYLQHVENLCVEESVGGHAVEQDVARAAQPVPPEKVEPLRYQKHLLSALQIYAR